jgi:hypothetical protein
MGGEETPPPPPAAPPAASGDESIPDWLMGGEETPPPPPAAPAETGGGDMPDWFSEESDTPLDPTLSSTGDVGLPSWLQGAEMDFDTPAPPGPQETRPLEVQPDREPSSRETPSPESSSFFGGADLPSWLRQPEPKPQTDTVEARAVSWLSSLNIQEEETDTLVATETPTLMLERPEYHRKPLQLESIRLLESLVAAPLPEAAPAEAEASPTLWERIGLERVLYVLLALALFLGALFAPAFSGFGLQSTTPNESSVGALAELVEGLSGDDIVLLAYEWDAQRIGELAPLEEAMTRHLIEQQVDFVSLSTDLQGTLLSFDLREPLREAGYQGGGVDYVLLGYRPGGELALRGLAQDFRAALRSDFRGQDVTVGGVATNVQTGESRLESLEDLAMIVVMADQAQDVQGWIEQVYRTVPDVPMVMLVPSEVEPVVQPYLSLNNVYALAGKRDALTYTELRGGSEADAAQAARSDAQLVLAIIVFIVLLVGGAVVGLLRPSRERS